MPIFCQIKFQISQILDGFNYIQVKGLRKANDFGHGGFVFEIIANFEYKLFCKVYESIYKGFPL